MILSGPDRLPLQPRDPVPEPLQERGGLLGVAEAEQRVDGERRVADPGVAVVPVALAADLLGQTGRGRGDERAGRRVGHQLERHRRAGDHLLPAAVVRRAVQPAVPPRGRVLEHVQHLLRRHRLRLPAPVLEHDPGDLPRAQHLRQPRVAVARPLERGPLLLQRPAGYGDAVARQRRPLGAEHARRRRRPPARVACGRSRTGAGSP